MISDFFEVTKENDQVLEGNGVESDKMQPGATLARHPATLAQQGRAHQATLSEAGFRCTGSTARQPARRDSSATPHPCAEFLKKFKVKKDSSLK